PEDEAIGSVIPSRCRPPPGDELPGQSHCFHHGCWISHSLTGDVKGGTVGYRGTNDGDTEGYRTSGPSEQGDGRGLVVIHGHHSVESSLHQSLDPALARHRPATWEPGFGGTPERGLDDVDFLPAEKSRFSNMRIDGKNADPGRIDPEPP